MKYEGSGKFAGKGDVRIECCPLAMVLDWDGPLGMRKTGGDCVERAQVGSDANGGEAGTGGLDACHEGQQNVNRMRRPGMRVGAGIAGDFRPGAEVQRKEFAPGVEGFQVVIRKARVIQRAGEIK